MENWKWPIIQGGKTLLILFFYMVKLNDMLIFLLHIVYKIDVLRIFFFFWTFKWSQLPIYLLVGLDSSNRLS